MPLLSSLLTGHTGLKAANLGISASSHNVSNAMTPGYHRRHVPQSIGAPLKYNGVYIGTGTQADRVGRSMDRISAMRTIAEVGTAAAAETAASQLSSLEGFFSESDRPSLRERLDGFFDALSTASASPADTTLRREVGQAASTLAQTVRDAATSLEDSQRDLVTSIEGGLPGINVMLEDVAALNKALKQAGGAMNAGDLADKRDQLLRVLAEEVGTKAHISGDGQATVLLGGHAIVSGPNARTLTLAPGAQGDPPALKASVDGGTVDVTSSAGGRIGGLLTAHDAAQTYFDTLGDFAVEFASAVNAQHAAGFDASGAGGADVFTLGADPATSIGVDANLLDDPNLWAFASAATANPGDTGNLTAMRGLEDLDLNGGGSAARRLTKLTSMVGSDAAKLQSLAVRQSAVVADLDELSQNLHGVDLDEEATNLIMYQTAYEASARVVQVTDEMLGTLLSLKR